MAGEGPAGPFERWGPPAIAADVTAALKAMPRDRNHLAVVTDAGHVVGVVPLADALPRLFPPPARFRRHLARDTAAATRPAGPV